MQIIRSADPYASQQPLLEPASWLLRGDYLRARFRPKDTLLPSDN
jgi:hypothetical protein